MVGIISPIVKRGSRERIGRGFSIGELKEVGLNVGEARRIGVPVDLDRRTSHGENVERLREWIEESKKEKFRVPKPKQSTKKPSGRAHRGLTSAGKKMRGLPKSP